MLPFDPRDGLIAVPAQIFGPDGTVIVRLAIDTGATRSAVRPDLLRQVGYDPGLVTQETNVITASGAVRVPLIVVQRLAVMGHELSNFLILSY